MSLCKGLIQNSKTIHRIFFSEVEFPAFSASWKPSCSLGLSGTFENHCYKHMVVMAWYGGEMAKVLGNFSPMSGIGNWRKRTNCPQSTKTTSTASPCLSPPVGLRLTPSESEAKGPRRNSPLCGAHEAMQNAHNLLILAQAGKIKPSGC